MERVKVTLPTSFTFSTILTIRINDLNYGGHVGNEVFLLLAHEARQQFLQLNGYTELNFGGTGLIMADAAIEYNRELNYSDQVKISVALSNFDRLGFDIFYLMEVRIDEEWVTAGKVKTGMICYDYNKKKKVSVPAEALIKFQAP